MHVVRADHGITMIATAALCDERLSLRARGLLVLMLAHTEGMGGGDALDLIHGHCPMDDLVGIHEAWAELWRAGYLVRYDDGCYGVTDAPGYEDGEGGAP